MPLPLREVGIQDAGVSNLLRGFIDNGVCEASGEGLGGWVQRTGVDGRERE